MMAAKTTKEQIIELRKLLSSGQFSEYEALISKMPSIYSKADNYVGYALDWLKTNIEYSFSFAERPNSSHTKNFFNYIKKPHPNLFKFIDATWNTDQPWNNTILKAVLIGVMATSIIRTPTKLLLVKYSKYLKKISEIEENFPSEFSMEIISTSFMFFLLSSGYFAVSVHNKKLVNDQILPELERIHSNVPFINSIKNLYLVIFSTFCGDIERRSIFYKLLIDELTKSDFPLNDSLLIFGAMINNDKERLKNISQSALDSLSFPGLDHHDEEAFISIISSYSLDENNATNRLNTALTSLSGHDSEFTAVILSMLGRNDEAIAEFEKIIVKKSADPLYLEYLVQLYFQQQEFEKAAKYLNRTLDNFASSKDAISLFFIYLAEDNINRAKSMLRSITTTVQTDILPSLLNGFLLFHKSEFEKAKHEFNSVLNSEVELNICQFYFLNKIDTNNPYSIFFQSSKQAAKSMLAEIFIKENNYPGALKLEYEVLEQDSDHPLALDRVSLLLNKLSGAEKAGLDFKRRFEIQRNKAFKLNLMQTPFPLSVNSSLTLFSTLNLSTEFKSQDRNLLNMLEDYIPKIKADDAVLLLGERGVGKELIAQIIHEVVVGNNTFVDIDCAGLDGSIINSRLFGIEEGTATEVKGQAGLFEQANGGTLFLDEIGNLPQQTQVKMLRVLEEKKVKRIGSNKSREAEFLLISATNKNLSDMQEASEFMKDFYDRISGTIPIQIPPLRERGGDIILLFLNFLRDKSGHIPIEIEQPAWNVLENHKFDGNVRELKKVVKRLEILDKSIITKEVMHRVLNAKTLQDLQATKLSLETRELIEHWKIYEFTHKTDLAKAIEKVSGKVVNKHTLNKRITSAFFEIGETAGWKYLDNVIAVVETEFNISKSEFSNFEKAFIKHLNALLSAVNDNHSINEFFKKKRWIYGEQRYVLESLIKINPSWLKKK